MLRVGSNLQDRVGTGPHPQIVALSFVLICDVSDRFWQGEDEVEIPHGQQLCFPGGQPCFCGAGLTFGTVTVTARIVGDVLMSAAFTPRDMTAECRRAAALDGAHHFELVQADVPRVRRTPGSTVGAEDIRNFQQWTRHGAALRRPDLALLALGPVQIIKRTVHSGDHPGCDTGVPRRRCEFGMSQQRLDHPDINAALQ